MKLKMKSILTTLVLAIAVLGNLAASMMAPPIRPRRVRLANTYDAAVTTHEAAVNRTFQSTPPVRGATAGASNR